MKAFDGEFEEVRDAFERTVKSRQTGFSLNLTRSSREEKNSFYDNGETDKFFQMFLQGYEFSKCLKRMEA